MGDAPRWRLTLEHFQERWEPVFRTGHAQPALGSGRSSTVKSLAAADRLPIESRHLLPDPIAKGAHLHPLAPTLRADEVVGASGGQQQRDRNRKPPGAQVVVGE